MKPRLPQRLIQLLTGIVLLFGCGDGPSGPPAGTPTSLSIVPGNLTLTAVGETGQLAVEVRDAQGTILPGSSADWASDRPGTVSVNATTGIVTAVSAGTATVTATSGTLAARAQVRVIQEPASLQKVSGDAQTGFVGEPVPISPTVRVLDANGHAAALVRVRFEAGEGGSVSPESILSDADGLAGTAWRLGRQSEQTLVATAGNVAVEFTATATELPLMIVTDTLGRARLTLSYSARLAARGGSGEGYVWSLGEGSRLPSGLELDPGGTIAGVPADTGLAEFEVRITDSEGADAGASLQLRVCRAPLDLSLGDVRVMDPETLGECGFYLQAAEAGAYYRVTLAGTDAESEEVVPLTLVVEADSALGGGTAAARQQVARSAPFAVPRVLPHRRSHAEWQEVEEIRRATAALHRQIRRGERELFARLAAQGSPSALRDRSVAAGGTDTAAGREPSPPEWTFRLAEPDARLGLTCNEYTSVDARLVTEDDHIALYEATDPVSPANADRILDYYANFGVPVIERYFGGVTDVNGDGRVVVLVDPHLTGFGGYVWLADVFWSQAECPASNEMELVHISADAFSALDQNRYWGLGVLVHEVKHLSSLANRYLYTGDLAPGTDRYHPSWIEEGTAEVAVEASARLAWEAAGGPAAIERVTGALLEAGIRDSYPEASGILGRLGRMVTTFAQDPNAIAFNLAGQWDIYGSGWHFHRFLRDRYGNAGTSRTDDEAFVMALNDSRTLPGIQGIESVTGETMENLLVQHAVAMSVAGAEDILPEGVPRFSSFDFPAAADLVSGVSMRGRYPWPATTRGIDNTAPMWADLATSRSFGGHLAANGVRFHDFRAAQAGVGATVLVEVEQELFGVRVIVARIPDPAR